MEFAFVRQQFVQALQQRFYFHQLGVIYECLNRSGRLAGLVRFALALLEPPFRGGDLRFSGKPRELAVGLLRGDLLKSARRSVWTYHRSRDSY